MSTKERKLTLKEVSQTFNLKELLGYEPSDRQRRLFYDLAVDKIVERTSSGKDVNGGKFEKYSKAYAEKKGVSRGSVDLILEGTMLSSFEESQGRQKGLVKIKMEEGVETKKAYNHCTGDTLPKRDFFGITKESELKQILREVDGAAEAGAKAEKKIDLAALRRAVAAITLDTNGDS
jgi:hypothetical protein